MAAIGKIRSWGPWLVGIIGLALFGFIATDFTRSCETSSNQALQQVGEVMGNKMSIQDYQASVEEYKNVFKQMDREVDEEELRDFVWENNIQNAIIAEEAEKLGLGVTDEELKSVLQSGSHPILRSLPIRQEFFNQQTGMFDYTYVNQYYTALQQYAPQQYDEFHRYWMTVEKLLRQQLLVSKYYGLLSACMLSNEVSAQKAFEGRNTESDIVMASLAYSTIDESSVKIEDKDLVAKYNEKKEMFKWNKESRDIKYVVGRIIPSQTDIDNLHAVIDDAAEQFKLDSLSVSDIMSSHRSVFTYHESMPYNAAGLRAISPALFAAIDSLSQNGVTTPVSYTVQTANNAAEYLAVAKLLRKYQAVDSIAYQYIGVGGQTMEETRRTADSIINVLNGGQPFDSVAISLGQNGAKLWISANEYQGEDNISSDFTTFFKALHEADVNQIKTVQLTNMMAIYKVVEKRQPVTLYDVAIVSNELKFSNDTYNQAYNKFSQYISGCTNADDIAKKGAENGYQVQDQQNLLNTAHVIGDVNPYTRKAMLPNTREAVKWVFSDAKEGSISKVFDNNSSQGILMAVVVTKIHPEGYLDQKSVEEYLRAEVLKDKRAEKLIAQLAGAKTIEDAQAKGAIVDTIRHITFPTRVNVKGVSEPRLSGIVAGMEPGQTVKNIVKGENGVYLFTVIDRRKLEGATFDRRQQEQQLINSASSLLQNNPYVSYTNAFNVLVEKAKVKDNRYRF